MKQTKHAGVLAPSAPASPQDSASVLAKDAYAGRGGQYLFDPVTGERRPIAAAAGMVPADDQPIDLPKEQAT